MTEFDDGGSVYPYTIHSRPGCGLDINEPGITLRDHYAGLAMHGIVSSGRIMVAAELVKEAFGIADEMIRASSCTD